jgi:hypothetical protein
VGSALGILSECYESGPPDGSTENVSWHFNGLLVYMVWEMIWNMTKIKEVKISADLT